MIGRLRARLFWMRIACNLLPLIAFTAAYIVRFAGYIRFDSTDYQPTLYFGLLVLTTLVWTIISDHYGLVCNEADLDDSVGVRRVVKAYALTHLILFSFLFFYRVQTFSRVFLVVSTFVLFLGAISLRIAVVRVNRGNAHTGASMSLLIVGADEFAVRVAGELNARAFTPSHVIGYVQLAGQEISPRCSQILRPDQMLEAVADTPVDEVIVALHPSRWEELAALAPMLDRMSAPVRLALDFGGGVFIRDRLVSVGTLNLASLTSTPLDDVSYLFLKRALDIAVAAICIALGAPIMLLIAVAIKLSSRGPVFFVQDRVGLNGKLFRMYKFRTMHLAPNREAETHWTTRNDAHCTAFGAFLRRTSLDELPQFFNVLKGNMSVVGPRPERPYFVRQFLAEIASYNVRHRLKVGITGWAQVNGLRGDTSIPDRVQYDLYYLKHWSLSLDLRIMAMTIWSGLFGKNAY